MAKTDVIADLAGQPDDAPRDAESADTASVAPVATLHAAHATIPLTAVAVAERTERSDRAEGDGRDDLGDWDDWGEPRLTFWQYTLRATVVALTLVVALALLAPIIVALLAAVWSLGTDIVAALNVAQLARQGRLLESEPAMSALSVASRIGFVAVGYLGYFFALMSLLAGLLGRGRGRLYIIPGALLTSSALVLLFTSVALAWPLIAPLGVAHGPLLALALYALLDAVALATALADTRYTRYTRHQWRRARRSAQSWRKRSMRSKRDQHDQQGEATSSLSRSPATTGEGASPSVS